MSELAYVHGRENLIVCFGGMALSMGGILPFEFLRYLSSQYADKADLLFYIDKHQCWYHKGIEGITANIDETRVYLLNKFNANRYKNIICMGVSAGGYAAILFGSLCSATHVIAFVPRTLLVAGICKEYADLRSVLNTYTQYTLYGDHSVVDINDNHHISQCERLGGIHNIDIIRMPHVHLPTLRDTGVIKAKLDSILNGN